MRNKILILIPIVLLVLVLVGCNFPFIPAPEPEKPVSEMEAVALAELDEDKTKIEWTIVNIGDVFIREYILTFEVYYPMTTKDYVVVTYEGEYLEVGEMHSGDIALVTYDIPKSVSVTWELFE